MTVLARHKAAWLEQLQGAKLLWAALKKRIRYIWLIVEHIGQLPRLIAVQQMSIQNLDESIGKVHGLASDTAARVRHHEHGPLMRSARAHAVKRQRLQDAALKMATAKTEPERHAAELEAAQLATDLEAESMPPADITIDAPSGQAIEGEPGKPRIVRLHEQ